MSGPGQSYAIPVSASNIAELKGMCPGVVGAATFVASLNQVWYWAQVLPLGVVSSTDGSSGATTSSPGGFWVSAAALLNVTLSNVMAQKNWFVDSAAGSDTASGATASSALKTDAARQLRMGPMPLWQAASTYQLRYLNDLPASDQLWIAGMRPTTTTIFVHGSQVDGKGKAQTFSGTVNALTALNRVAPQHSWEITANALPVSWTASGLVGQRLTLTSGASSGARAFPMVDLGGKAAKCCQFLPGNAFAQPYVPAVVSGTPALNNTFIVESVVSIPNVLITLETADDFLTNTGGFGLVFDSLALGANDMKIISGEYPAFDGCTLSLYEGAGAAGIVLILSSRLTLAGQIPSGWGTTRLYGGYADPSTGGVLVSPGSGQVDVDLDFMVQTGQFINEGGFVRFFHFANFASALGYAIRARGGRTQFHSGSNDGGGQVRVWGDGNAGVGVGISGGETVLVDSTGYTNGLTITGASGDFSLGSALTGPAYDRAAVAWTAARAYSWVNYALTVAGGGFNFQVQDPGTGAGLSNDGVFS